MMNRSPTPDRMLFLEPQALMLGLFVVVEAGNRTVREFDSLEEAYAYIAQATGISVAEAEQQSFDYAVALRRYRDSLRQP